MSTLTAAQHQGPAETASAGAATDHLESSMNVPRNRVAAGRGRRTYGRLICVALVLLIPQLGLAAPVTVSDSDWNTILYGTGTAANPNGGRLFNDDPSLNEGVTFPQNMTLARLNLLRAEATNLDTDTSGFLAMGPGRIAHQVVVDTVSELELVFVVEGTALKDLYPVSGYALFQPSGDPFASPDAADAALRALDWANDADEILQAMIALTTRGARQYLCRVNCPMGEGWYTADGRKVGAETGYGNLPPKAQDDLRLHVFDVGAGNCILVECPGAANRALLVDCGAVESARVNQGGGRESARDAVAINDTTLKETLLPILRTKTEFDLILTHADQDHYNLIPDLLFNRERVGRRWQLTADALARNISNVYAGGNLRHYRLPFSIAHLLEDYRPDLITPVSKIFAQGNSQFEEYRFSIRNADTDERLRSSAINANMTLSCGTSTTIRSVNAGTRSFAPSNRDEHYHSNPNSIILEIEYGGSKVILTGDAYNSNDYGNTLTDALNNGLSRGTNSTILVAPHHGSNEHGSGDVNWINAIQPTHLIFSHGQRFGHPSFAAYSGYVPYLAATEQHTVLFDNYPPSRDGSTPAQTNPQDVTTVTYSTWIDGDVVFTIGSDGAVRDRNCYGPYGDRVSYDVWCSPQRNPPAP